MELDFSPETLPVLDRYLIIAREALAERTELEPLLVRAAGAYFGEVVRRVIEGFWRNASADTHHWHLCARHAFLSFNPAGMMAEALAPDSAGPPSELWIATEDRELVAQRLEALPRVSEEEYVLPSTRLEVIEFAHEALRARMRAEGIDDVLFEPDDYADMAPSRR